MRVRILTSFAGPCGSHVAGEEVDLNSDLAVELLNAGYAEPVGETRETASMEAPETAAKKRGRPRKVLA